jgi:hypothetical protein
VGVQGGYEWTVGRFGVGLGARADLYVPAMVVGIGAVLSGRVRVVGPLGVTLSASAEGMPNGAPSFRSFASVVSAGIDLRL